MEFKNYVECWICPRPLTCKKYKYIKISPVKFLIYTRCCWWVRGPFSIRDESRWPYISGKQDFFFLRVKKFNWIDRIGRLMAQGHRSNYPVHVWKMHSRKSLTQMIIKISSTRRWTSPLQFRVSKPVLVGISSLSISGNKTCHNNHSQSTLSRWRFA